MKQNKLIIGAVAMALTLTTGVATYAAAKPQEKGMTYQDEISMDVEGALSLKNIDKNNLPDGVHYMDEISMNVEGALSFENIDKNNLPDGVHYVDEVSVTDENAPSFHLNK